MSVGINRFEWDDFNMGHLRQAHPDLAFELLEDIVLSAKQYSKWGSDECGKKIFGARRGRLVVLFSLKEKDVARIFSVREVGK